MNIIRWHSCVRDNYANGKFARIESDCTFYDGLRSCINNKQHFVNKAVQFIPAVLRTEKLSAIVGLSTPCCFICLPIEDLELVCSIMRWYRFRSFTCNSFDIQRLLFLIMMLDASKRRITSLLIFLVQIHRSKCFFSFFQNVHIPEAGGGGGGGPGTPV